MLRWLDALVLFICLHNTYHFCHVCLLSSVCSILATAQHYCVLLHERQLVQYDEEKKKQKKTRPIPKSVAGELEQQGADPGSTHVLFYVRFLSLYMQMAWSSQISFEVIKSLHCSL